MSPIAVLGAAGKTGIAVTKALAARGAQVRAVVHRAEQVGPARDRGAAEAVVADLADPATVASALDGAAAVYVIAPNVHPDEPGLLKPVIAHCERQGPTRLVYHSVIHPNATAMPHHLDKARVEARLYTSRLDWTILQPASYQDNAAGVWDSVRLDGIWPLPYSPAAVFTPVALADVAEVAALVLTGAGHSHATYELAGPQTLSTADMADLAADVLGRQIRVVPGRDAWRSGPGAVLSTDARARLEAMFDYYDGSGCCGGSAVSAALLGRPPARWVDWVRAHR